MGEPMTDFEARLSGQLQAFADRAALDLPASRVVTDVFGRPTSRPGVFRRLSAAGAVAALVLVIGGVVVIGPRLLEGQGSMPAMATVNDREYWLGVGRSLVIDESDLVPYGTISAASYEQLVGRTAYLLPGVEPTEALVTSSAGIFEDQDSPGEYALLWGSPAARSPSAALCSYFSGDARRDDFCPPSATAMPTPTPAPTRTAVVSPTSTPTPSPPTVRDIAPEPWPDAAYQLGSTGVTFSGVRVPGLGPPDFSSWLPAQLETLVLGLREADGGTSVWLADLHNGTLTALGGRRAQGFSASGDRILIHRPDSVTLVDRTGGEVASLEAVQNPGGVFLADGTIAVWTGGPDSRIGVWDPTAGSATWSPWPADGRFTISPVGNNIALVNDPLSGPAWGVLLDPRTGRELGPRWSVGEIWHAAASPDGSRFVIAVASDPCCGPHGAVEMHDATTGEVLATNDGVLLSHVVGLAWPTENVILVLRAETGTEAASQPELLQADRFTDPALRIEAFVPDLWTMSAQGNQLVFVDEEGPIVVVSATEVVP